MKKRIMPIVFLFFNFLAFSQKTINISVIVSKTKVCFTLLNTTSDTLKLPGYIMMPQFRNKPVEEHDFQFKDDTFNLLLFDYGLHIVTSDGPVNVRIEGEMLSLKLAPHRTYRFYMKMKHAQKQFKGIRNIAIKTNWVIPTCKTQAIIFGRCKLKTSKYLQLE